jgi:hypothetical protein
MPRRARRNAAVATPVRRPASACGKHNRVIQSASAAKQKYDEKDDEYESNRHKLSPDRLGGQLNRSGEYQHAASWYYRKWEDGADSETTQCRSKTNGFMSEGLACQWLEHETDHGEPQEGGDGSRIALEIAREASDCG